ncbi:MAG: hypothetical protein HY900_09990 [Deltaproteobacteria bacterium]|nr:hypothetical protein [Deltaproteobacteria bacterium]
MQLRITKTTLGPKTTLHVDGRLAGSGVDALERASRAAGRPLAVDLSNLLSADARGIQVIRALAAAGSELIGVTAYFQLLLEGPLEHGAMTRATGTEPGSTC